tara:strand:- start:1800 stop:2006 length:207 start_codon:yes stop_codon:yes gene_type:complete
MGKRPFLNQISRFIRLNGYSLRTEKTYLYWIKAYIRFHQRQHPNAMGPVEVMGFLDHLASDQQVSSPA